MFETIFNIISTCPGRRSIQITELSQTFLIRNNQYVYLIAAETHTHIYIYIYVCVCVCVSVNYAIVSSDNGSSHILYQVIIWTSAYLYMIEPLETNSSEFETISFTKVLLKMSFWKRRPRRLGIIMFTYICSFPILRPCHNSVWPRTRDGPSLLWCSHTVLLHDRSREIHRVDPFLSKLVQLWKVNT